MLKLELSLFNLVLLKVSVKFFLRTDGDELT